MKLSRVEEKENIFCNTRKLFDFLKMGRVNMWFLAASAFFSMCFSLLMLYSIHLLFPMGRLKVR